MPLFPLDNLVQTASVSLTSNITTASTTYSTILTLSMTTTGGNLIYLASTTSSNSGNPAVNLFRIQLDGITVASASTGWDGGSLSATSIQGTCGITNQSTSVTAGSHTITLQWARTAGTARINGSTGTNNEQAIMIVAETYT